MKLIQTIFILSPLSENTSPMHIDQGTTGLGQLYARKEGAVPFLTIKIVSVNGNILHLNFLVT
jgi:hypothetical protein